MMILFIVQFNEAGLRPNIQRPLRIKHDEEQISVKFIDDFSAAASYNLLQATEKENVPLQRPLTFHQRTGHKVKQDFHTIQKEANEFIKFTDKNGFVVNAKKSEVITFNFSTKVSFPPDISMGNGEILKETNHTTLLGVILESNLKWAKNTEKIYNKAASRLWMLRRLKRFDLDEEILKDFYIKEIRSIVEYAVPVWSNGITLQQSKTIEKIQMYSVAIILNNWTWSYYVKCTLLNIEPLFLRRNQICLSFSVRTAKSVKHAFFEKKKSPYNTRSKDMLYDEFNTRSQRFYNSPLVSLTRQLNQHIRNKT